MLSLLATLCDNDDDDNDDDDDDDDYDNVLLTELDLSLLIDARGDNIDTSVLKVFWFFEIEEIHNLENGCIAH